MLLVSWRERLSVMPDAVAAAVAVAVAGTCPALCWHVLPCAGRLCVRVVSRRQPTTVRLGV
jgi:hypothetical protein